MAHLSQQLDASAPLEITLLGDFRVAVHGAPLPRLRSRQEAWLLALLILRQDRNTERTWLASTLWPESTDDLARFYLRRSLMELRKALGRQADRILSPSPHSLRLDLTDAICDLTAFDAAIARGDAASLETAAALYRGPLAPECREEWAHLERSQREQAYLAALETLASQAAAREQWTAAVRYLRLTISTDPFRESAHCALMQALAACGDYASVTQVHHELRLFLRRELDAAPAAETDALYQRLQQQAKQTFLPPLTISPPSLRRLPVPLTNLIGREHHLAEVVSWLREGRMVTLLGPGGVGKTRLAIAAAETLAPDFSDGVWFVELAALTDPALAARTAARTLGVKEEAGRSPAEALAAALTSRSLLLILDNCEHLAAACASLADELLSTCPRVHVLATSREPLRLIGERIYSTPSLALPPADEMERTSGHTADAEQEKEITWLMEYAAVRLFVERALLSQPAFRLTRRNAAWIARIVHRLDGVPLAIELAAARLRSLSVEEIGARLDDRFSLLIGGQRTALPRHQTLRALIDWSYDLLESKEQLLLRRLAVFAGGWTLEAAEQVCSGEDAQLAAPASDPPASEQQSSAPPAPSALPLIAPRSTDEGKEITGGEVVDLLTSLIDKSLVVYELHAEAGRYRLLETVREYATLQLRASGQSESRRRKHRDYFLQLAEEAKPKLQEAEQTAWLERLETEHDNLRAALNDCDEAPAGDAAGLRIAAAIWRFWNLRGHLSEGRSRLAAVLSREDAKESPDLYAEALHGAGWLSYSQSDYAAAHSLCEQSLAVKRERGDQIGIAALLSILGNVVSIQGDAEAARSCYEQSLAIFRELSDKRGIAEVLTNLGNLVNDQGDYAAARSFHEQSLAIKREMGNKRGIAVSLNNLGDVAADQGDVAAALSFHEQSLALRRELDDRQGVADSLNNLARLAAAQNNPAKARTLLEQSLAIKREFGNARGIAFSLHNLGNVANNQGDYPAARSYYEQGLTIFRKLEDKRGIAFALHNLGNIDAAQGDYASAYARYEQSLMMFRKLDDKKSMADSLHSIASMTSHQGRHERAVRLYAAGDALYHSIGAQPEIADKRDKETAAAAALLGEEVYAAAAQAGRNLSLEEAIEEALAG